MKVECTYIKCNICNSKLWSDDGNSGEWSEDFGAVGIAVKESATAFSATAFTDVPLRGEQYTHYCIGECAEQAFTWWLKTILNPENPYAVGLPKGAKNAGILEQFSYEEGERLCPGYTEMLSKIKAAYARREEEFAANFAAMKAAQKTAKAERAAKRAAAKAAKAEKVNESAAKTEAPE
jgi:hypothetical protein